MRITGSNIETMNGVQSSKDIQVEHLGVTLELITTKRGIAFTVSGGRLVKDGSQYIALPCKLQRNECECEIIQRQYDDGDKQ